MKKFLLIIAFFAPLFGFAQGPKVSTSLSADTVWIGDQLFLQVDIEKDVATQLGLPEFKEGKMTEKLEIIGAPTIDTISKDGRNIKLRVNYTITSFDAGNYVLQGFPFVLENPNGNVDTLKSNTVNYLHVKTFEIDTTKQEIFDIKEPLNTPLIFAEIKDYVMWGGIGAVVLAILLYFLIKWLKSRRVAIANRPKEPAHIIAIKALEALQHKKMWQSGNVKEYYSLLSDILRQYIENRYDVGAMEMTSDEILDAVKELNSGAQVEQLREFAMISDLVKFAKWTPQTAENEQAWQTIYNYVEQTKLMVISDDKE